MRSRARAQARAATRSRSTWRACATSRRSPSATDGVERVFAMRAGREVRVVVDPGAVDDESAALIAHEIAAAIEKEMDYPGRIKITVVRESRATSFAS